MDYYSIGTIWVVFATVSLIIHNIYVWDSCSDNFKREITSFKFYASSMVIWPVLLGAVAYISITVAVKFRKWKKENGFN